MRFRILENRNYFLVSRYISSWGRLSFHYRCVRLVVEPQVYSETQPRNFFQERTGISQQSELYNSP